MKTIEIEEDDSAVNYGGPSRFKATQGKYESDWYYSKAAATQGLINEIAYRELYHT